MTGPAGRKTEDRHYPRKRQARRAAARQHRRPHPAVCVLHYLPRSDPGGGEELQGIRAYIGTLTPFGGSERYEPVSAATRTTLTAWARSKDSGFDAVIDFDAALRDPHAPESLPAAITRDQLHPNDEGYSRMAESIDLALLGCKAP